MEPSPPPEFNTCLGDLYSVAFLENRCTPCTSECCHHSSGHLPTFSCQRWCLLGVAGTSSGVDNDLCSCPMDHLPVPILWRQGWRLGTHPSEEALAQGTYLRRAPMTGPGNMNPHALTHALLSGGAAAATART
jgi:hypothetical protein